MTDLYIIIAKEFNAAKKTQNGTIARKDAIKVLQNVFKQHNGTVKHKEQVIAGDISINSHNYAYASGFGYGYGGFLSQTKDLFDLYMDRDSDGGEALTQQEQNDIINTVKSWFKSIKNSKQDTLTRR